MSPQLHATALAATVLLAACSVAPTYQRPDAQVGAAFKESVPESAQWKLAQPSDALARGEWWTIFGDPKLDELQAEAARANQTLRAGFARLAQARAAAGIAESQRFPQIEAGFGATRLRASPASQGLPADAGVPPQTLWRAQAFASYEVDLFGRVANAVAAARADVEQTEGLYKSLLLAIQADVAANYLALRGLDAEIALLAETVRLREQALALVERRLKAGEIAELDVARAKTELATTRAERTALERRRAEIEHALAVLVGKTPAELSLAPQPLAFAPIAVPAGLPSSLLERRPDIAAAERAMAAANARIGVARAAWFPRLTLTGLLGLESAEFGDLARSASRTWALGPLAGTALSLTVFDGGRRAANERGAEAAYEEAVAAYRQTVLGALREVEDGLSGLRLLAQQAAEQANSVESAQRAADLSGTRYRAGYVNYLEVIDAERQVLATRRAATQIERERALATVALIRALGGGWEGAPKLAANMEQSLR
jgi:multidrug efflux system outer membrane protein